VNITTKRQARAVTLVELLVSIGITVAMLLMTGVVFKSSTKASGKAMARNAMMNKLRAITRQIDQDFTGLRPDMPLAIIFEEDIDLVRYDRIWFFANGDYQTTDFTSGANISGNVAHIFYGQSLDAFTAPEDATSQIDRRILTRREKFITADGSLNWFNGAYVSPNLANDALQLDYMPATNAGLNFWKNIQFNVGVGDIFNTFFRDNMSVTYSVIRRSQMVDDPFTGAFGLQYFTPPFGSTGEGFQRLYVANDVTDFKIEAWFPGANEWFPNATDLYTIARANLDLPDTGTQDGYAFYWNAPGDTTPLTNNDLDIDNFDWRSETDIQALIDETIAGLPPFLGWSDVWPEALKFTFTLYDKNRRHFPDGETFSYIVKIPTR
jgi:hypothetical protein